MGGKAPASGGIVQVLSTSGGGSNRERGDPKHAHNKKDGDGSGQLYKKDKGGKQSKHYYGKDSGGGGGGGGKDGGGGSSGKPGKKFKK